MRCLDWMWRPMLRREVKGQRGQRKMYAFLPGVEEVAEARSLWVSTQAEWLGSLRYASGIRT